MSPLDVPHLRFLIYKSNWFGVFFSTINVLPILLWLCLIIIVMYVLYDLE